MIQEIEHDYLEQYMMQRYNMQELADIGNNNNNFVSPLESIKAMCKDGMHMPSLVETLSNLGSQKLCDPLIRQNLS